MNTFVTFRYQNSADGGASIYAAVLHPSNETEEETKSEFDKFLDRYGGNTDKADDFKEILAQIDRIRDNGFDGYKLRFENAAHALPAKDRRLVSTTYLPTDGPLRLYCILLKDNVLVLCGGGAKGGKTVQESDGVKAHFSLANKLAQKLTERIAAEANSVTYQQVEAILENETIYL